MIFINNSSPCWAVPSSFSADSRDAESARSHHMHISQTLDRDLDILSHSDLHKSGLKRTGNREQWLVLLTGLKSCRGEENHQQPWKSHLGCWSCDALELLDGPPEHVCVFVVVRFQPLISSATSHVLHGQATLVPLSLPTWEDSWVAHHRTDGSVIPAVNAAHCWLFSHTGLYLGYYCVCLILFICFL